METLTYQNEDDKAFGLAGMAVSLAALDALDRISEVSLDSDGPMVTFSHEYYFCGSPSISPKATWDNLVRNFHITTAMAVSNLMARCIIRCQGEVPPALLGQLYECIVTEGEETCALEPDEIENLYNRTLSYSRRIFANPRLHPALREFARQLSLKRTLSGRELAEEMARLRLV